MSERGAGQPKFQLTPTNVAITYHNISRNAQGDQGSGWFGPLMPMQPMAPAEVAGRAFDLPFGYNLNTQPRAYEPVGFATLRMMAYSYDLVRLVIETRKDQVCRLDWTIKAKEKLVGKQKPKPGVQSKIDEINAFFKRPDGVNRWTSWLRGLLEDLYVIDAPTLYCQRTRAGKLLKLEQIDGSTIKRVIDDWGRTPQPYKEGGQLIYPPAYQEVLKGYPAVDYSVRDIVYRPRNIRPGHVYGLSPVEQILITVNIALRRQMFQLAYYTEGNVPESLIGVPETWTPEQIASFQTYWDAMFTGNLAARRHAKFVPGGIAKTFVQTKEAELKNVFDEWLARVVCYCFSISPQSFVSMMNRGTGETQKEMSEEEGLEPTKQWVKELVNDVIETEFGADDIEFAFEEETEIDPTALQGILSKRVEDGMITINEAREQLGEEPSNNPAADVLMAKTATGFVPIEANTLDGKKESIDVLGPALLPSPNDKGAAPGAGGKGNPKGSPPGKKNPPKKGVGKLADAPFEKRGGTLNYKRPVARAAMRRIKAAARRALKITAASVTRQVRKHLSRLGKASEEDRKIAEEISSQLDLSDLDELANYATPELEAVAADMAAAALVQVGVTEGEGLFEQANDRAIAFARNRAAELVGKKWDGDELVDNPNAEFAITDSTRDMVRVAIANGLDENLSGDEIADSIADIAGFSAERAELIASAEIRRANSMGALEGYRVARDEAGVNVKKEWLLGDNPCPICEENADEGAIDLDDEFPSGDDAPPAHPNCECAISPVVDEGEDS